MIGGFFMGMKKGQKHYPEEFKVMIVSEHYDAGKSLGDLVKEYSVSRAHLCIWCQKYREGGFKNLKSKTKGRPKSTLKQEQTPQQRIKELEMEVELLKAFLFEMERWNVKN
jgi:transposase-like protein